MHTQSTSVNSEIQAMIEMGLIKKRETKSSKFFANIKNLIIFTLSYNKNKNKMKKSINIETIMSATFVVALLAIVSYNMVVYGTPSAII